MAESESTFEGRYLPVLRQFSGKYLAGLANGETLAMEAESEAYLGYLAAPDQPPESIAYYAIKRVKSGRQHQESARSMTGPNPRRVAKPVRELFDPRALCREGDDPALIVATRLDYWAWMDGLPGRKQRIVRDLANGETTQDVAARYGLSEGRVSQIRRECLESWRAFTA